jgi:hypothetical protein
VRDTNLGQLSGRSEFFDSSNERVGAADRPIHHWKTFWIPETGNSETIKEKFENV